MLTLDGGGAKGFYTLGVLKEIEAMVKDVLEAVDTPYAEKNYTAFLQGSYGNDTNIFAESDVDIVIQTADVFFSDVSRLTELERNLWDSSYKNATYTYQTCKQEVLAVLTNAFGNGVKGGDKAIAISRNGIRRKADVIVAAGFRRYCKFNGLYDETYDEGICFFNAAAERIENYPKQHSENLTRKHQASGDSYLFAWYIRCHWASAHSKSGGRYA